MVFSAPQISPTDELYPPSLTSRLQADAPEQIAAIGDTGFLSFSKTALFCSARCPGDAILGAYDQAAQWRDEGRCIISGFHSPIEKECLRILLRGTQPIIICPACGIEGMRLRREWREALEEGRMLLLSPFGAEAKRVTTELARLRNTFVVAFADEVVIPYASPGGEIERVSALFASWSAAT